MGKGARKRGSGEPPRSVSPASGTVAPGRSSLARLARAARGASIPAGGAALALLAFFDIPVSSTTPGTAQLAIHLAVSAGLAIVAAWFFRKELGSSLGALAALFAGVTLAAAMGLAPELLALPTGGLGDRLWGVPTLLGLPLAGALLVGREAERGSTFAGCALALALAGLLQPFDVAGDIRIAFAHHIDGGQPVRAAGVFVLVLSTAAGLCAIWVRGQKPQSPLATAAGALLLLLLPGWQVVRLLAAALAGSSLVLPAAGLVLSLATTACLLSGLPGLVGEPPEWVRRFFPATAEGLVVICIVALWVLLKAFTWRWSSTDENIYFYDAVLLSRGSLPYRDFFFAHPPLHIAVPAALFAVFGFSITLAKLIPAVAALLAGLMCWLMVRERLGRLAGVATLGCFLFAFELLQASTNMNGVNLTSLWLVAALFCFVRGRHLASGVLAALAVTTGFYAVAGALALAVLAFFRSWRDGARQAGGLLVVAGAINLLCWVVAGDAFLESVYKYHVLKHRSPLQGVFLEMLFHHAHLAVGVLLCPVLVAWQHFRGFRLLCGPEDPEPAGSWFSPRRLFTERGTGAVRVAWLVFLALLVEFTRFSELYDFYFALLVPTAAICTGYVVAALAGAVHREVEGLRAGRLSPWAIGSVLLVFAFGGFVPVARETNWAFSSDGPRRVRQELQLPPAIVAKLGPELAEAIPAAARQALPPKVLRDKLAQGRWLWIPPGQPAQGPSSEFLEQGERREYPWIEPSHLRGLAGPVVRALFWRDHRIKWDLEPGYRHFLWQKSLHMSVTDDVAAYVRERSAGDETVAGNSLTAPAVALASGRRIAGAFVDTNAKRFGTGLVTVQEMFEAVCADRIRFLVSSPSGFVNDQRLESLPTVRKYFRKVAYFPDPWNKFERSGKAGAGGTGGRPPGQAWWGITLWEILDAPAGDAPRCHWICRTDEDCKDGQRCERGRCAARPAPVAGAPRPQQRGALVFDLGAGEGPRLHAGGRPAGLFEMRVPGSS